MLVPLPFEAKLSLPGLRRACASSSRTPLTGVFAETTSTFAPLPTSATGARSFLVSKGSVLYSDTLIALGGEMGPDVAPRAGAVLDDHRLPQRFAQARRQRPRGEIGDPARRKGDDD